MDGPWACNPTGFRFDGGGAIRFGDCIWFGVGVVTFVCEGLCGH
jgi:hypothetical protein